ncbi:hypothetical protein BC332_17848 [Capsicum chinense]|nr:hypothetical protein BC332_17848 [Capsicum chinense]
MARSIYFVTLLVLAITLLVANEAVATSSPPKVEEIMCIVPTYASVDPSGCKVLAFAKQKAKHSIIGCKRGVDDSTCKKACVEKENFEDGRCGGIIRYCWCSKPCVFDNIPNDAGTILVQDAKIFEAELLEKELMMV